MKKVIGAALALKIQGQKNDWLPSKAENKEKSFWANKQSGRERLKKERLKKVNLGKRLK